ncbi:dihydropteroate synthase [Bogoriella caseilytica]|uniref:Dihydropteroate synthase n=1 Tax=Bogoriella caseilytica TaxID=56055 RepID=A0A3N2BBB5_9MICO|nr:dihydropteroate synthase [Bogoriella caseilytica]ROR72462.1 dihydropteroate synthase [Bogoriella caseilytica]
MPRTLVMGVLNVTPDSFSDGGRWADTASAVARGQEMLAQGADIIDVGGESTRPGAATVPVAEEIQRVVPVVEALSNAAPSAEISVDTTRAAVAQAALDAGARIVNDVSGGQADPQIFGVIARSGARYVLQHRRGTPETMNDLAVYQDVVAEVRAELAGMLQAALAAGVSPEVIIVDPGLGFAKQAEHNWRILAHLEEFTSLGYPLLIGASRKRFLDDVSSGAQPGDRDNSTAAVTALAAAAGVWGVRVHSVPASLDAVRVAATWREHR